MRTDKRYFSLNELESTFDLNAIEFDIDRIISFYDVHLLRGQIRNVTDENPDGELFIELDSIVQLMKLRQKNIEESLKPIVEFLQKVESF